MYWTGFHVGWPTIQNDSEDRLLPLFDNVYQQLIRRFVEGEDFDMPVQKALPKKVFVKASPEHKKTAMENIKNLLK